LGYVGLPLAMTFERAGFNVIGMDLNADRVAALANGESYVAEVTSDHLREAMTAGRFVPTTHLDIVEELNSRQSGLAGWKQPEDIDWTPSTRCGSRKTGIPRHPSPDISTLEALARRTSREIPRQR
jgi:hypothetical protein